MLQQGRNPGRIVLAAVVAGLAAAAVAVYVARRPGNAPPIAQGPATQQATQPATAPATGPATRAAASPGAAPPQPATRYIDVLRAAHPTMPATQPLAVPLDLPQAARFVLKDPVYLSPRGDLWITRPDAPPTADVLAQAAKDQGDQLALTVRENVVFAHWRPEESEPWSFHLVCRRPDGGYEVVSAAGRLPIESDRRYDWGRALDWNDRVVVPTDAGISVFRLAPQVSEIYLELADPKAAGPSGLARPQVLLDWQGLLAWVPWENGKTGSRGAARFVNDAWTKLGPEQGWPEKILHLVPLQDGSVLQLAAGDAGAVKLAIATLEKVEVDEPKIIALVESLSASDEETRQKAFNELTQYGPGISPLLERLINDQPPEAQARLKLLLKNSVQPTLGGMSLMGNRLKMVTRHPGGTGGATFYAETGVTLPGNDGTPVYRVPAWLSIQPGQPITLLNPLLIADLDPDKAHVYALGDEWIVHSDVRGPRWFVGNGFVELLRKNEASFSQLLGIDHRGRWLFRKPTPATAPAGNAPTSPQAPAPAPNPAPTPNPAPAPNPAPTPAPAPAAAPAPAPSPASPPDAGGPPSAVGGAAAEAATGAETLVIDPTLPDPTPRLPVWVYATGETAGWDKDNWPAVKRGGVWVLREDDWKALDKTEKLFSRPEEIPGPAPAAPPSNAEVPGAAPGDPPSVVKPEGLNAQSPNAEAIKPADAKPGDTKPTDPKPGDANSADTKPGETSPSVGPGSPTTAGPASAPADEDSGPPILTDPEGTRYYDGRASLRLVRPDGQRVEWPLPAIANGSGAVHLIRSKEGLLFLFNQPGRVLRIRPTPAGAEPFVLEATFTRKIPSIDKPNRIWLDPAGRIVIAHGNKLVIMFPQGYVPPRIAQMMPGDALDNEGQ